jgi:hypothetical protein
MPPEPSELVDLADLKMLPAWVKEPVPQEYRDFEGETEDRPHHRGRERPRPRERHPKDRPRRDRHDRRRPPQARQRAERGRAPQAPPRSELVRPPARPLAIEIGFLPQPHVFEAVAAQIKGEALAYSLFSLARLFLQKPERYDVRLAAKPESPLYQLGEHGTIAVDRHFLENNAFRFAQNDFYKIDITQSEPIKGNFTSIARDPLSRTLLGPPNYHTYQPRLRTLYEQRFSRRMSFAEYQRQIEIVSDPALVEKWKEDARTVTTFTDLSEEPQVTFNSASDAEKHFRHKHLPELIRITAGALIDGGTSRALADRVLHRRVEDAWSAETRSPTKMMQELAGRLRASGLHVFRHRRGMLFVSPIRPRPLAHDQTNVSPQVKLILETIAANPPINRKNLADKLMVDLPAEELEPRKLALASDLRWLIGEGHVIEFNDGSLDLPRMKQKATPPATSEQIVAAVAPTAEPAEQASAAADVSTTEELEIGGS